MWKITVLLVYKAAFDIRRIQSKLKREQVYM